MMTAAEQHAGPAERREQARSRWEAATRWPLIVLSIGFLVGYSLLAIVADRPPPEQLVIGLVMAAAWLAFIIDPLVRLALTARGHRPAYFSRHRIEFFSAVLPILRPFSLLRHLEEAPGFRGNGGNATRSRVIATAAAYAAMFVYVVAISVLWAERGAEGASIDTLPESIWWAAVTVATVGYGDFVPVTGLGRALAVALMAGGVVIIGTASAIVVSYLSERIGARGKGPDERVRPQERAAAPGGGDGGAPQDGDGGAPQDGDGGPGRSGRQHPGGRQ